MVRKNQIQFNTAIITYPSDYEGLLSIGLIVEKLKTITKKTTKCVVAREDPDEEIQRIHYHMYWDEEPERRTVTTKYFDIKLPEPVVVIIHEDKTREYKNYNELSSVLGIDNLSEMVPKVGQYVKENYGENIQWDYLEYAHPNIQLKKEYGDKYFMLKYVVKQKLVARSNFDVEQELKYLEENAKELTKQCHELIDQDVMKQLHIETIEELIDLCKKYSAKIKNKNKRNKKEKRKYKKKNDDEVLTERKFCELIRNLIHDYPGITRAEVLKKVREDEQQWYIYASRYINYNKLITDCFKNTPKAKINRNYEWKFWLPIKLYDYIMWLDKWVEKWTKGEEVERRPKGLIIIGGSRTGKSSLMSLIGDYCYFKNIWSIDNWEYLPPYTIMDDMDAVDEGKGLSFSWFKPFFGAQDSITVTDKYRPKEDIVNGKPLIWLNNFDITETFKSLTAQDYIRKNMEYINIGNRPLYQKPEGIEIFEYKEFDPKTTWYYKNIVKPEMEKNKENETPNINTTNEKRKADEEFEKDKGRPAKRNRTEDSCDSSLDEHLRNEN